jgi:hypothetical protein
MDAREWPNGRTSQMTPWVHPKRAALRLCEPTRHGYSRLRKPCPSGIARSHCSPRLVMGERAVCRVDVGHAAGHVVPRVLFPRVAQRVLAKGRALGGLFDRLDHGIGQRPSIIRLDQPPIGLARSEIDEARRPTASGADDGSSQAMASRYTRPNGSSVDGCDEAVGTAETKRELVVVAPATEEHVLDPLLRDHLVRMLALPLARKPPQITSGARS